MHEPEHLQNSPDPRFATQTDRWIAGEAAKAAAVSFLTGLVSNPVVAAPLTVADEVWVSIVQRRMIRAMARERAGKDDVNEEFAELLKEVQIAQAAGHHQVFPESWLGQRSQWLVRRYAKRWLAKLFPVVAGALNARQTYKQVRDAGYIARQKLQASMETESN